jgi:hypothetical protein
MTKLVERLRIGAELEAADTIEELLAASSALIADVQRRYPNEELRCPHMIALNSAVVKAQKL